MLVRRIGHDEIRGTFKSVLKIYETRKRLEI